jgi:hypothetical protein
VRKLVPNVRKSLIVQLKFDGSKEIRYSPIKRFANVRSKNLFISLISVMVLLAGCNLAKDQSAATVNGPVEVSKSLTANGDIKSKTSHASSKLMQAIFDNPTVARSFAAAKAASLQTEVVKSGKNSKLDFNGSAGLAGKSGQSAKEAGSASVTAYRLLSDNGQTDLSIVASGLAAEIVVLEAEIVFDDVLRSVLESYGEYNSALKKIDIIDFYINAYEAQENLVEAALQAGALSNSDYLELQSLKNDIFSDHAKSKLALSSAESFLRLTLGSKYSVAMLELLSEFKAPKAPIFGVENSIPQRIIELRRKQLELEIEIQKRRGRPTSQWQASISSPESRTAKTSLFAGVTIVFPVKDGGEAEAKIAKISQDLELTGLEQDALGQETALAEQSWNNFVTYFKSQEILLIERKSISEKRINELQLRLKAGRSNVIDLAKEILAGAQSEIALIDLNTEYFLKSISSLSATNRTCVLFNLCGSLPREGSN